MGHASEDEASGRGEDRRSDVKTVFVVGLGMVGIGESWSRSGEKRWIDRQIAFIEKLLNLDEAGRYRVVTCGEEVRPMTRAVGC